MIEMHGRVKCTSSLCRYIESNHASPICPALGGTETFIDEDVVKTIQEKDLPRCSECKALARPSVVWFGETPHDLEKIDDLVEEAGLCIVVGTSSTERCHDPLSRNHKPAELIWRRCIRRLVMPQKSKSTEERLRFLTWTVVLEDEEADFLFLGPCEETLPKCLGIQS